MSHTDHTHDHDLAARDKRAIEEEMTVMQHIGDARGDDDLFLVVSQSGREYLVDVRAGTCTCPDHQERGAHCKHLRRTTMEAGMRPIPALAISDLTVSDQLDGEFVDGEPRLVTPEASAEATSARQHAH